jgi:hypothetical protein
MTSLFISHTKPAPTGHEQLVISSISEIQIINPSGLHGHQDFVQYTQPTSYYGTVTGMCYLSLLHALGIHS